MACAMRNIIHWFIQMHDYELKYVANRMIWIHAERERGYAKRWLHFSRPLPALLDERDVQSIVEEITSWRPDDSGREGYVHQSVGASATAGRTSPKSPRTGGRPCLSKLDFINFDHNSGPNFSPQLLTIFLSPVYIEFFSHLCIPRFELFYSRFAYIKIKMEMKVLLSLGRSFKPSLSYFHSEEDASSSDINI
jgi:hypothetical protein